MAVIAVPARGARLPVLLVTADGEALVVDPAPDVQPYLDAAADRGVRIRRVLDTHVHADHVSGARELARRAGATLHCRTGAGARRPIRRRGGRRRRWRRADAGSRGRQVVALPGHTTDMIGVRIGDEALIGGDSLFLDSVARPDLEAGDDGSAKAARQLTAPSASASLTLPPTMLLLPCHYAGGRLAGPLVRPLGDVRAAVPELDLGEDAFVRQVLAAMPPRPANYLPIIGVNLGDDVEPEAAARLEVGANNCAVNAPRSPSTRRVRSGARHQNGHNVAQPRDSARVRCRPAGSARPAPGRAGSRIARDTTRRRADPRESVTLWPFWCRARARPQRHALARLRARRGTRDVLRGPAPGRRPAVSDSLPGSGSDIFAWNVTGTARLARSRGSGARLSGRSRGSAAGAGWRRRAASGRPATPSSPSCSAPAGRRSRAGGRAGRARPAWRAGTCPRPPGGPGGHSRGKNEPARCSVRKLGASIASCRFMPVVDVAQERVQRPLVLQVTAGRAERQVRLAVAQRQRRRQRRARPLARRERVRVVPVEPEHLAAHRHGKPSPGTTGEPDSQPPLGVAETMLPCRSMMSRWHVSPRVSARYSAHVGSSARGLARSIAVSGMRDHGRARRAARGARRSRRSRPARARATPRRRPAGAASAL